MHEIANGGSNRRVAAEVLELGETLFDAVMEAAVANRPSLEDRSGETFPEDDFRVAADEFFRALRVLLGLDGRTG
jgi:hypothetical protein